MKKMGISKDEAYPVFHLVAADRGIGECVIEVSEDLIVRYEKIKSEYRAMQKELRKLYGDANAQ